jgi:hypothetical protein
MVLVLDSRRVNFRVAASGLILHRDEAQKQMPRRLFVDEFLCSTFFIAASPRQSWRR